MNQGVHPDGLIAEPGVLHFDTELVSPVSTLSRATHQLACHG